MGIGYETVQTGDCFLHLLFPLSEIAKSQEGWRLRQGRNLWNKPTEGEESFWEAWQELHPAMP